MTIKSRIRTIPDSPHRGIMPLDISTLIENPVGFRLVIDRLTQRYIRGDIQVDLIGGIETRGFIIGGALSYTLGKGLMPIRKRGKLQAEVVRQEYEQEYGRDTTEVHLDAIVKKGKILLVGDLLATGRSALSAASLVEKLGGSVSEMAFVVNLPDLGGYEKLRKKGYKVFCLRDFERK
jgi:adenine phosphoribosyltransferase